MLRHVLAACLAAVLVGAPRAQGPGSAVPGPLAADLLRQAAAEQAHDATAWAAHEQRVQRAYAEWAQRYRGWRRQTPPPPPDLSALALPVPFLAARWLAITRAGGRPSEHYDLVAALARSADLRAHELLLEQYDQPGREQHRSGLAARLAPSLSPGRAAAVVAAQLRRAPPVLAHELLFLLLQRCRGELPPRTRRAAADWLATFPGGPGNGAAEQIWKLRFDLGDASDRDALIPHLLGAHDLLYSLSAVLHAPMPHARLADALRERRARMTPHELGYLAVPMSCALVATDPDHEVAAFVARIDELRPRVAGATASRDEADELQRRLQQLADVPAAAALAALEQHVQDDRFDWHQRCALLEQLLIRRGAVGEPLRRWWLHHAPPELERQLAERLRAPQ